MSAFVILSIKSVFVLQYPTFSALSGELIDIEAGGVRISHLQRACPPSNFKCDTFSLVAVLQFAVHRFCVISSCPIAQPRIPHGLVIVAEHTKWDEAQEAVVVDVTIEIYSSIARELRFYPNPLPCNL